MSDLDLERARQVFATLGDPQDEGHLATIDGSRLGGLRHVNRLNQGFAEAGFTLLGPDGRPLVAEPQIVELQNRWRFSRLRLTVGGDEAWTGRVMFVDPGNYTYDRWLGLAGDVNLKSLGYHTLYSDRWFGLPGKDPDSEDEYQASVEFLITEFTPLVGTVAQIYTRVAELGLNVPLQDDLQKTPYAHIMDGLKGTTAEGIEHCFGVDFPEDGPYLIPVEDIEPVYRLSVADLGIRWPWNGDEYVPTARGIWTDDSEQQVTEPFTDSIALALHHGVLRDRAINLDRIGAAGADGAVRAFVRAKRNPVGPSSTTLTIDPLPGQLWATLTTIGGTPVPGWKVREGQGIYFYDLHPSDRSLSNADRVIAIAEAAFDYVSGQLQVTLRDRSVRSLPHELPAVAAAARSLTGPGGPGQIILQDSASPNSNFSASSTWTVVDTLGTDGVLPFSNSRESRYELSFNGVWRNVELATGTHGVGYDLDGEDGDTFSEDNGRRIMGRFEANNINERFVTGKFRPRRIGVGPHTIRLWCRATINADLGAPIVVIRRP